MHLKKLQYTNDKFKGLITKLTNIIEKINNKADIFRLQVKWRHTNGTASRTQPAATSEGINS